MDKEDRWPTGNMMRETDLDKTENKLLLGEKMEEGNHRVNRDELELENDKDIGHRMDLAEDVEDDSILIDQPEERRAEKIIFTGLYCLLNIGTGILPVMLGSILLDLEHLTGADSGTITWIFTGKAVGMCTGIGIMAALSRFPYRLLHILVLIVTWLYAASLFAMPFCRSIYGLMAVTFAQGVSTAIVWAGGTISMAALWRQQKSTSLFILTFGMHLGFMISPPLSYPFTNNDVRELVKIMYHANKNCTNHHDNLTMTYNNHTACHGNNIHPGPEYEYIKIPDIARTQWNMLKLCSIVATPVVFVGTSVFLLAIRIGPSFLIDESNEVRITKRPINMFVVCFFFGVAAVVQFVGDGQTTLSIESYLETYVITYMDLGKKDAAMLTTVFTATYVAWALIGIYFQRRFGATVSFCIMVTCNLLGTSIIMFSGKHLVPFCVGSVLLAIGLSGKSPSLICWVSDIVGRVKELVYLIYACWAIGDIVHTNVVGRLVDLMPEIYTYVLFTGSLLMVTAFVAGHMGYVIIFGAGRKPTEVLWAMFTRRRLYQRLE